MTEAEWLACTDPARMLAFLGDKASDRKLRLFACACCRKVWGRLRDQRLRVAVEACERVADGLDTPGAQATARSLASGALDEIYADASEQRWHYIQE
jgi:hypothetical protein